MSPGLTLRRRRRPKTALVLGAGGVLGAAWMTGALPALQERMACAVNDADVIVGTSAGSVVAAALRCGVSIAEMIAHQRGETVARFRDSGVPDLDEVADGPWPPRPRLLVGSPRLMLNTVLRPHRIHPVVGVSAWLPRGRGSHAGLHAMVDALHRHAHRHPGPAAAPLPDWVGGGKTWIVAVDYDSGRRVVFGREGAPPARLADAVAASCSVPGWYRPVVIGGRRYVDGGVRSTTSLGVVARSGVDEVHVLAPMASIEPGRTRKPHERLERRVRALATSALLRDVHALRRLGMRVTVLTPGPEDLAAMGVNLMDPRRREQVLETSLRTSPAALPGHGEDEPEAA
ncbi:MAG: patatin-like phospholipase family protein [Gemmatimonadota bacterium]